MLALLGWFFFPLLAGEGEEQLLRVGAGVSLSPRAAGVVIWILSRQNWKGDEDLALEGVELQINGTLYCVDTISGNIRRIEGGQAEIARPGLRDTFWLLHFLRKYR